MSTSGRRCFDPVGEATGVEWGPRGAPAAVGRTFPTDRLPPAHWPIPPEKAMPGARGREDLADRNSRYAKGIGSLTRLRQAALLPAGVRPDLRRSTQSRVLSLRSYGSPQYRRKLATDPILPAAVPGQHRASQKQASLFCAGTAIQSDCHHQNRN